jgi:hypothetical protein
MVAAPLSLARTSTYVAAPGERRPKHLQASHIFCLGYSQNGHSCLAVLLARKITDVHSYLFGLHVATCLSKLPCKSFRFPDIPSSSTLTHCFITGLLRLVSIISISPSSAPEALRNKTVNDQACSMTPTMDVNSTWCRLNLAHNK